MNSDQHSDKYLSDPVFQSVLVSCLEKLERGESLDHDELHEAHPNLADALDEFLANQEMLRRVASQVRDSFVDHPSGKDSLSPVEETIDSNPRRNGFSSGEQIRYVGQYEIVEEIARGGMGVVFKARQQKLKRIVALKMILAGQLADEADVERFQREAQAAGQLRHPHIVAIHEIGEHDGHHYFTMDYIDGHSLADRLRDKSISPQEAAVLLKTLAETIHFAHQKGTLHRDLKPANILIDSSGTPHVTDFGLAKAVIANEDASRAELTASGQILGTPSHMSPEQASGKHKEIGPAADIYSLGSVLFACLTGRAPFVADTPVDTLLQVIRDEPLSPRLLNSNVPRDLNTICLKCLGKSPKERYATAADLAADLERFLAGDPIQARLVGPLARGGKWAWKQRKALFIAAAAMVVGTLLTYGGWSGWSAYQQWRSGELVLTTTRSQVVAELTNEAGELAIPRFAVPTPTPVSVPAGEYRMRLSAPGRWSEEYQLTVHRGQREEYVVGTEQQTWPPIRVEAEEYITTCRLDGQDDILLLHANGIRRLDGRTQELIWKTNLEKGDYAELDEIQYFSWRSAMDLGRNLGGISVVQPPRPIASSADLNGDGLDDLIIVAADSGVALALSGASGELLWTWAAQLRELPEGEYRKTPIRRLDGMPAVTDIDDDGVPDLVFWYAMESRWNYVEAVSGASGDRLWGRPLFHKWEHGKVTETIGGSLVVCNWREDPFKAECIGLARASGETRWQWSSGIRLLRAPEFVDVDGDGATEAIFVEGDQMRVRDLDGQRRCSIPLRGPWTENRGHSESSELHDGGAIYEYGKRLRAWNNSAARLRAIVDDIDGDGQAEILLPGPRLVSATDGKVLWDQGEDLKSEQLLFQRYLVGPDVDGDGVQDIATARLEYPSHLVGAKLTVAALSGAKGNVIWSRNRNLHEVLPAQRDLTALGAALWGPSAPDGLPLFLIPCRIQPQGATHHSITAYGFSLSSGELIHKIENIADPRTADVNGDGLTDLCWFTPHPANGRYLPSGTLHAISGQSPVVWQRPEILKPVGDLNNDGSTDLASFYRHRNGRGPYLGPVTAICGSTGRKLWRSKRNWNELLPGQTAASHTPDDAGTAETDVVLGRGLHGKKLHLFALSKSDGRELWMASNLGAKLSAAEVQIDTVRYTDMNRDGQTEAIIGFLSGKRDIGIAVLDTTNGTPLWFEVRTTPGSEVRSSAAQVVGVAALDEDDVDDVLLLHFQEGLRHFRACSGADGRLLWERTFPGRGVREHFTKMHPIADVDGDGDLEVLVIDDQVLALNGETGEPQWSWIWPDREQSKRGESRAGEEFLPRYDVSGVATLADLNGDDTLSVCFIAHNHLIALDGSGQPRQRTKLVGHSPKDELSPGYVWAMDADGDDAEELIFVRAIPPKGNDRHWESDEQIFCYSNDGMDLIWKWAMPAGFGQIMKTLPATDTRPATVVVLSGESVFGISGVTGKPVWRCDGERWWGSAAGRPERYRYFRFGPRLLDTRNKPHPTVMFRQYQPDGKYVGNACRLALPTNQRGRINATSEVERVRDDPNAKEGPTNE